MCIICLDLEKGLLTPWEAKRNLGEMVDKIGQDHAIEVEKIISKAIFSEIRLNYGDTIIESEQYCDFCDCDPCDCSWGHD